MSELAHLFEDFSKFSTSGTSESLTDLPGFDDGYNAGWEDATHAHKKVQEKLRVELSEAIQSQTFTFQEARIAVLSDLESVIESMVRQVLPKMMYRQFGNHVVEAFHELIVRHAPEFITIRIPPDARNDVEMLLPPDTDMKLEIEEDASLEAGQCRFEAGSSETELDLTDTLKAMNDLVSDYFSQLPNRKVSNG